MKLLDEFRQSCREWHKYRKSHNHLARQRVYIKLMEKYGDLAVLRRVEQIKAVLDKVEKGE